MRFMTTQAARSQATYTVMLIASDADENKKGLKPVDFSPFWRKRWDSNPRAREDYLISSQGRYDHFDTLPYGFVWLSENFRYTMVGPLCPVAVPKICCSLSLRQILTAATPFCSLYPPPAALANIPTSIRFRMDLFGCLRISDIL